MRTFADPFFGRRDIKDEPVIENADGSVGVFDYQRQAFSLGRNVGKFERRIDPFAKSRIFDRNESIGVLFG